MNTLTLCHCSAPHQNLLLYLALLAHFCLNQSLLGWLQNGGLLTIAPPALRHWAGAQSSTVSESPSFSSSIYFLPPSPPFFLHLLLVRTHGFLFLQWFVIHHCSELLWRSNCLTLGQWEFLDAGSHHFFFFNTLVSTGITGYSS